MNPNLIIHNAKIYTVDEQLPWAEAVAVHNGRFHAIGTNQDILNPAGLSHSHRKRINNC
jgi:hypothetical protein